MCVNVLTSWWATAPIDFIATVIYLLCQEGFTIKPQEEIYRGKGVIFHSLIVFDDHVPLGPVCAH